MSCMVVSHTIHSLPLVTSACRFGIRKFSFANRIVDLWNGLDESVVASDSIKGFKNSNDKHFFMVDG